MPRGHLDAGAAPPAPDAGPSMTLAICTRDRPQVREALASGLASVHPRFEVLLVDQSSRPVRDSLPTTITGDPRFRYLRLDSRGLGRARNAALRAARAEVVAFTDDDCTLPGAWLRQVEAVFTSHPGVAVTFTNVVTAPHDATGGFIPSYERSGDAMVKSMRGKRGARGIGAAMAVRRAPAEAIGGFDDRLGAGAEFPSCEDGDLVVRLLLAGRTVFECGSIAVVHHGFRTWEEGRRLARRNWIGVGAAYSKPLKCGKLSIVPVLGQELSLLLRRAASHAWHGEKPRGLHDAIYLLEGILRGLRTPVDRRRLIFTRPPDGGRPTP
jgi:glycosyltransferase involved in cell wall biosynthesis